MEIPQIVGNYKCQSLIIPDRLKDNISVPSYTNAVYYQENETEVLISEIVIYNNLFVPTTINGKLVTGFTNGYSPNLSGRYYPRAYLPADLYVDLYDKKGTPATFTYSYIENSDSISITGYIDGDTWIRGGTALEDLFNKPIDTIVLQSGLDRYGIDENRSKNIVTYQKDEESDTFKIIEIKQGGDEKSTVTIPESIGGIPVSRIEDTAIKEGVTSIIVPEKISVPSTVNAVKYTTNADGSFTVTSVSAAEGDSGNAEVKFPETIGNSKVETVIANEDVVVKVAETADKIIYKENEGNLTLTVVQKGTNNETVNVPDKIGENPVGTVIVKDGTAVEVPPAADKITYKEDENGKITVTDIQKGENNETVKVPEKIGENPVDSVLVKDEDKDKVDVPNSVGKITYTEDEGGNVTITSVTPATDESGKPKPVTIPDIIGGSEPKISDEVKETIKDIPHTHKTEEIPAVSATCTQPGLTAGAKCSLCGEVLTAQEEIPALGHSWDNGEVTTAATCTTDGEKTYTCTVCGATKTETVAKLGHTKVTIPSVAPTCTETGLTEGKKCSVCGEVQPDHTHIGGSATCTEKAKCEICGEEYGEFAAHSWNNGAIITAATCTANGEKAYTCTVCNATKTEAVAKSDHTEETVAAVAPTCITTGLTEGKKCSVCGTVIKAQETVTALGHNYVDGKCSVCGEVQPDHTHKGGSATCTEKAKCEICGQEYGELAAHSWNGGEVTTAATCTADGVKTYVCTACSATRTEMIPANGHEFKRGRCTVCGATDPNWKGTSSGGGGTSSGTEGGTSSDTSDNTSSDTSDIATRVDPSVKVIGVLSDDMKLSVEKSEISTEISAYLERNSEWSLAQCYDIDLYKNNVKINMSSSEIIICIEIPVQLRATGRVFAVLRVHNGDVEVLNDIDDSGETVTIKTDRFSQYALICKAILDDSSDTSGSSDTSDSSDSSDSSTSDSSASSDSSESSITESSDNSSETHDTSSTADDDNNNPNTGYMFSLLPVLLLAGGAMMFVKKSRK